MATADRVREWFLTIHEEAPCFADCLDTPRSLKTAFWAGIVHDKDEDTPRHIHIALRLVNGITFTALQKKFEGAHIDRTKDFKKSVRYLIHRTENAKDKHQYEPEEIITEYPKQLEDFLKVKEENEPFDPDQWKRYIMENTLTPWAFTTRFGLKAWKEYGKAYMEMVSEFRTNQYATDEIAEMRVKDLPFMEEEK